MYVTYYILGILVHILSQNFRIGWSWSFSHPFTSTPSRHSPYLWAFEMLYLHFDATRGPNKDDQGVLVGRGSRDGRQKCIFARNPCTYCNCWLTWRHLAAADNLCASAGCLLPFALNPLNSLDNLDPPPLVGDSTPRLPLDCTVSQLSICLGSDLACCVPCACHQVGLKWQSRFNGAESVSEGVPSRPSPFHTFHRAIGPSTPYPSKWTEYIYRVNNQSISVQLAPFSVQNSANEAQLGPLESSCDCNSCSLSISLSAIVKS